MYIEDVWSYSTVVKWHIVTSPCCYTHHSHPLNPSQMKSVNLVTRILVLARPFWNLRSFLHYNVVAKKPRQRTLIFSGGDRILSEIEKLRIFTIIDSNQWQERTTTVHVPGFVSLRSVVSVPPHPNLRGRHPCSSRMCRTKAIEMDYGFSVSDGVCVCNYPYFYRLLVYDLTWSAFEGRLHHFKILCLLNWKIGPNGGMMTTPLFPIPLCTITPGNYIGRYRILCQRFVSSPWRTPLLAHAVSLVKKYVETQSNRAGININCCSIACMCRGIV